MVESAHCKADDVKKKRTDAIINMSSATVHKLIT